uniref:Acylsugar acyltransferase 3-like n=2 Tax=Nicotiana TaxID=4085 RepID=A0A1S3XRH5_TOBAC|nr:PREDICTED: deacetylvindoline O-acetyltransferase-like [Nicotiana sylvestris]XP_016442548.1 PREDICTED: acylsugar acyltransferase 3-like [Nicotiana tabacum]
MVESTILSKKMIKPSSPTPSSLSRHNLSFIDQIASSAFSPIVVFYSKPTNNTRQILENSLSKVLSSYYPFAGRIKDDYEYVECNDTAISGCLSHKIADGYSLLKLLKDWAATARLELDFKPSTQFDVHSFSSSSLDRLKDIVAMNSQVQNPIRVEVATALLHKCGSAVSIANLGVFQPSLLCHLMNFLPPLPQNTIGNACYFFGSTAAKENETQSQLRKAKQYIQDKSKDPNQLASHLLEKFKERANKSEKNKFDFYMCSRLCNLGVYKIDFGWGEPIRVTLARNPMKSNFIFLDSPNGDGINVLITLTEADMLIFQSNKELLEFASPVV